MKKLALAVAVSLLAGCAATGEHLEADVFDESSVNSSVPSRLVTLLNVSPTRIAVDNKQQKQAAQVGGALLGVAAGALLGNTRNRDTAIAGGVLGGVGGGAAGSLVKDKVLVPGVLISWSEDNKIKSVPQVGKLCQFAINQPSLVMTLKTGEDRVQPNAECPAPVEK